MHALKNSQISLQWKRRMGTGKTGAGSAIKVPSYSREARKDTRGFSRKRLREAMGGGAYMVQVQLQLQPLQVYELYSSLGK